MAGAEGLRIQVAYARPDLQHRVDLVVPPGTTIRAAIERSRIQSLFPEIDLAVNRVGVFGVLMELTTMVAEGDRVEIYRPLLGDPKEARRRRAR